MGRAEAVEQQSLELCDQIRVLGRHIGELAGVILQVVEPVVTPGRRVVGLIPIQAGALARAENILPFGGLDERFFILQVLAEDMAPGRDAPPSR